MKRSSTESNEALKAHIIYIYERKSNKGKGNRGITTTTYAVRVARVHTNVITLIEGREERDKTSKEGELIKSEIHSRCKKKTKEKSARRSEKNLSL